MMRTRAAVAVEAGKPLEIMEVNLDGPRKGEVLVEIKATGRATRMNSPGPATIPKGYSRPFWVTKGQALFWKWVRASPRWNPATT